MHKMERILILHYIQEYFKNISIFKNNIQEYLHNIQEYLNIQEYFNQTWSIHGCEHVDIHGDSSTYATF